MHALTLPSHATGVLCVLERLYEERPEAMQDFFDWIAYPSHTQTVVMRFREGKLQAVELTRTSR